MAAWVQSDIFGFGAGVAGSNSLACIIQQAEL